MQFRQSLQEVVQPSLWKNPRSFCSLSQLSHESSGCLYTWTQVSNSCKPGHDGESAAGNLFKFSTCEYIVWSDDVLCCLLKGLSTICVVCLLIIQAIASIGSHVILERVGGGINMQSMWTMYVLVVISWEGRVTDQVAVCDAYFSLWEMADIALHVSFTFLAIATQLGEPLLRTYARVHIMRSISSCFQAWLHQTLL